MTKYDCIIPWSGGVESTAVVNWAINKKLNPLCIHNRMSPGEWESVQNMSKILDVEVFKYEEDTSQLPLDPDSRYYYSNKLNFKGKWSPVIHRWVYWCLITNLTNPTITKIYYGHCGAGSTVTGDGQGDRMHDGAVSLFRNFEEYLKIYHVESKFIAPLDHLTKREQWLTLPEELKREIYTCPDFDSNVRRINCKSYDCHKCHELMKAVPNEELHYIK
tara:strand:- start:9446 stop:10099 length:654 start_codon:yes stop_codon:yes gene_type:complete